MQQKVQIGRYNRLPVIKAGARGLHLDAGEHGEVIVAKREFRSGPMPTDTLRVFLYFDGDEQVVATTHEPFAQVGEFACLEAVTVSDIGAFLDWGLPKDLFVPKAEQLEQMEEGDWYIVYVYKDPKRNRLAASGKIDNFVNKKPAKYKANEAVDLMICFQSELGYEAIINHQHLGLLYAGEVFSKLEYGQKIKGYVKKVRDDGKIDLSLQPLGYKSSGRLEDRIMEHLNQQQGQMLITDKSAPELIYATFGVSKKKFKMALGALYKRKQIVITDNVIKVQGKGEDHGTTR